MVLLLVVVLVVLRLIVLCMMPIRFHCLLVLLAICCFLVIAGVADVVYYVVCFAVGVACLVCCLFIWLVSVFAGFDCVVFDLLFC